MIVSGKPRQRRGGMKCIIVGSGNLSNSLKSILDKENIENRIIPFRSLVDDVKVIKNDELDIFVTGFISRRIENNMNSYVQNIKAIANLQKSVSPNTRFLFASSIDVYGNQVNKIDDRMKYKPFDYYSKAKIKSEELLSINNNNYTLILPGLFGGSKNEGSVISRIIMSSINDRRISLTDPGIRRVFLSYDDAAEILFKLWQLVSQRKIIIANKRIIPKIGRSESLYKYAIYIAKYLIEVGGIEEIRIVSDKTMEDTRHGRPQEIILQGSTEPLMEVAIEQTYYKIREFIESVIE